MNSSLPLVDVFLWLRWIAAGALIVWLPGYLLAGRSLRRLDATSRTAISIGVGLLGAALFGQVYAILGVPLTPWTYAVPALSLALLGGSRPALHRTFDGWIEDLAPLNTSAQILVLFGSSVMGTLVILGFGNLPAPHSIHDAANHAFIVARVVELASVDSALIFDAQIGHLDVLYLPGWHGVAALLAQTGGVAPYISAWYLPIFVMILVPISLALWWRASKIPALVAVGAALLVVVNPRAPAGSLGPGLYGQIIGMFLVPMVLLSWRAVVSRPTRCRALVAGLALGTLVTIHASQAVAVIVLAPLLWSTKSAKSGSQPSVRKRDQVFAILIALVAAILVPGVSSVGVSGAYVNKIMQLPHPSIAVSDAVQQYLGAGGTHALSSVLAVTGLLLGMWNRTYRPFVITSLVLGLFFVAVACWDHPVIERLSIPFYREHPRVRFLQNFLLPPLMALPIAVLWQSSRGSVARGTKVTLRCLVAAILMLALLLPVPRVLRSYERMNATAVFTVEEFELAEEVRAHVGVDDIVANFRMDGSVWAMHVSGRRFLQPCSWALTLPDLRLLDSVVAGLADRPWHSEVMALQEKRVRWLYVSDLHVRYPGADELSTGEFDEDKRFLAVARGGRAALYRILWEKN